MLVVGSICTMIASALMFRTFRRGWPLAIETLFWEIKYSLLAVHYIVHDWLNAKNNKNDCPPQPGRIAIVTGGSRGIGFEVVKKLLALDMEVIIACRTPSAGEKAIHQIRESGVNTGQAKVYELDNASLESVRQFAAEIKRDYKEIHVLINNAGIMFCPYEETADGFEQQWAVNYLSHFLLTALLLPLLKAGGMPKRSSRIVNITSCAHLLGNINFDDTNNKSKFITQFAYSQSKFAQEVFTKRLQTLLEEKEYFVQAYSVHPGVVLTELFEHSSIWKLGARSILQKFFFKDPERGAVSITFAAVNGAVENHGGTYISNCRPGQVHSEVFNVSLQKRLFELSLRQVQLDDFFQHVQ